MKTPALTLIAQPLPLTTREREIANLVAQGLGSLAIEKLVAGWSTRRYPAGHERRHLRHDVLGERLAYCRQFVLRRDTSARALLDCSTFRDYR